MKKVAHSVFPHVDRRGFSLSRRGAWGQVVIAAFLITVLPALVLAWFLKCRLDGVALPPAVVGCAGGFSLAVIGLGYALLIKYPVSIVRLRSYLSALADGNIPSGVSLPEDEDDLAAVQRYMESVVKMAEDRVRLIRAQYEVKLESERQRVMVESIGAMCHHLGQPATIMSMCLYRLKNNPRAEDVPEILADGEAAFNAMSETLDKLRLTARYRSESYLYPSPEPSEAPQENEDRIIKSCSARI